MVRERALEEESQIQILVLPLTGCVILGGSLALSED